MIHHAGMDARHVRDAERLSRTRLRQVTYYEFRKEEVDAAMEGHKRNQRSLSHVPSRIENKEAFNILMVSTRPLPADLLLTCHQLIGPCLRPAVLVHATPPCCSAPSCRRAGPGCADNRW